MTQICETLIDILDPARARALQVTLGLEASLTDGDPLPPFYHQIYFWTPELAENLGRDGHPKTGRGIIPNLGLPRRMWAGGALEFHAPLRAGKPAKKTTQLVKSEHKTGRTGPLGFVKLQHDITQEGELCVREIQDLVYREDPEPTAPMPKRAEAPKDETVSQPVTFSSTQLFRYSALTFNGHRIHYDEDYSRTVEGYGGLVTHGPLLAQLLMLLAERELGALKTFSFRGAAPLFHHEKAVLCWKDGDLWVRAEDGGLIMTGTAT